MGATFATFCADCAVESPEIGDFGYIGRASLDRGRRKREPQNFGYIYEGLAALKLLTPELEAFRAFLDAHDGHRLVSVSDDGPVEGDPRSIPARTKKFRGKLGRFKSASYQIACRDCDELWTSPTVARVRPFKKFRLGARQVALFEERVLNVDDENFYRVGDALLAPDDELGSLGEFIREHRGHELSVGLSDAPSSPIPKALL